MRNERHGMCGCTQPPYANARFPHAYSLPKLSSPACDCNKSQPSSHVHLFRRCLQPPNHSLTAITFALKTAVVRLNTVSTNPLLCKYVCSAEFWMIMLIARVPCISDRARPSKWAEFRNISRRIRGCPWLERGILGESLELVS